MASENKVILMGNVGKDPESRNTSSGKLVANCSLATQSGYGENKKTDWHRLVFFDKLAEVVMQYVQKGKSIYVVGRIQYREWEKDDGTKGMSTEIIVNEMQLLGSRDDGGSGQQGGGGGGGGGGQRGGGNASGGGGGQWGNGGQQGGGQRSGNNNGGGQQRSGGQQGGGGGGGRYGGGGGQQGGQQGGGQRGQQQQLNTWDDVDGFAGDPDADIPF